MNAKAINVSESIFKLKLKSCWPIFQILSTSEVFCKQRLLFEHNIVQYLQNCKCYDVYQGHFRKLLQSYSKIIKRIALKEPVYLFTGC